MSKTDVIRFYVNETTKTVVAKMTISVIDLARELDNSFRKNPVISQSRIGSNYARSNLVPFWNLYSFLGDREEITFEGKAQCVDDGVFNEDFGKALARARLMTKVYDFKAKIVRDYYREVFNLLWHSADEVYRNFYAKADCYQSDELELLEALRDVCDANEYLKFLSK